MNHVSTNELTGIGSRILKHRTKSNFAIIVINDRFNQLIHFDYVENLILIKMKLETYFFCRVVSMHRNFIIVLLGFSLYY